MIPDCILFDVFVYEDRETLEIAQLACCRFNACILHKLTMVCLRSIQKATICGTARQSMAEIELAARNVGRRQDLREITSKRALGDRAAVLEWLCRRLRSSVIIGELHLNSGGHSDIISKLTDFLTGTVVDVRGMLHLNLFTSPDILDPFTRVHGLRLYGDTRVKDRKICLNDAWLEASLRKAMSSIDAGDYVHESESVGLEPVLDFCFGDRPSAARTLVARLRWADEEAVLNRIVQRAIACPHDCEVTLNNHFCTAKFDPDVELAEFREHLRPQRVDDRWELADQWSDGEQLTSIRSGHLLDIRQPARDFLILSHRLVHSTDRRPSRSCCQL